MKSFGWPRSLRLIVVLSVVLLGAVAGIYAFQRHAASARRVYRVGYVDAPPFEILLPDGSAGGFVPEVFSEAARRANVQIEWVLCDQDGVNEVLDQKADLWPLAVVWPGRQKQSYFTDPWMETELRILIRKGSPFPSGTFTGILAHKDTPAFVHLMQKCFPSAQSTKVKGFPEGIKALLEGRVEGLLYTTWDTEFIEQLLQKLDVNARLQGIPVPKGILRHVIVSRSEHRDVADRLRRELDGMASEGTLADKLRHYSWQGVSMIQTTYQLLEERHRARRLIWIAGGLALGFLASILGAWSLWRTRNRALRAEVLAAELLERYTLAARATNDVIWDWDPDSGKVVWSEGAQALFGCDDFEIGRETPGRWACIHPEDRDRVLHSIQELFKARKSNWSGEYRYLRKDKRVVYVVDRAHVVYSPEGRPLRMIGAILDLTSRRNLEAQLHQAQKMEAIGRLAGGVAHDFNNLLTVLNGYSDLLLMELPIDDPSYSHAFQIRKVSERAWDLVKQLLAFSHRQIIEPCAVDLNALLRDIEPMLRRLVGEDIELLVKLTPEVGPVFSEVGQLNQVIMNLVVNARDAMPSGGTLLLETCRINLDETFCSLHPGLTPGDFVQVSATDSGSGMEPELIAHIFEPFFTTKGVGNGTGLGLATVYGIIQQNHGYISVYSEIGIGTTFKIYLPACEAAYLATEGKPESMPERGGTECILVVEDQEDVRMVAVHILTQQGYRVLSASNGEEALVLTSATAIDLLLTDVIMPKINGRELAERVQPLHPEMRVLYMSGYPEDLISHHGVLESGMAFLPKPFSRQALLKKVRECLEAGKD